MSSPTPDELEALANRLRMLDTIRTVDVIGAIGVVEREAARLRAEQLHQAESATAQDGNVSGMQDTPVSSGSALSEQASKPEGSGAPKPYDIREWIGEHAHDVEPVLELLDAYVAQARRDALEDAAAEYAHCLEPTCNECRSVRDWLRARAAEVK